MNLGPQQSKNRITTQINILITWNIHKNFCLKSWNWNVLSNWCFWIQSGNYSTINLTEKSWIYWRKRKYIYLFSSTSHILSFLLLGRMLTQLKGLMLLMKGRRFILDQSCSISIASSRTICTSSTLYTKKLRNRYK